MLAATRILKAIVVSEEFAGKRLLQRHREINEILKDELANHIHALVDSLIRQMSLLNIMVKRH